MEHVLEGNEMTGSEDPNIKIARVGMQSASDTKWYSETAQGKAQTQAEIDKIIEENKLANQSIMQALEEELKRVAKLIDFWMTDEEKENETRKEQELQIIQQQHQSLAAASKQNTQTEPPKQVISSSLSTQLLQIDKREKETLGRYKKYNDNIEKVDKFIDKRNHYEIEQSDIEKEIKRLDESCDEIKKSIDALIEESEDDKARERLDDLNGINLQIGTLKDMVAVKVGEKVMYNKDGMEVTIFQKADFVVPKDKKIVKEGEELYLLGINEVLTKENKPSAAAAFKRAEPELSSVKELIKSNLKTEITSLKTDRDIIKKQLQYKIPMGPIGNTTDRNSENRPKNPGLP